MLIFWPRWKPGACIIAVPPNHPTLDSGESAAAGGGRAGPKPVPISTFSSSSSSSSSWCACTCCQTGWSTPGPDRPPLRLDARHQPALTPRLPQLQLDINGAQTHCRNLLMMPAVIKLLTKPPPTPSYPDDTNHTQL